MRPECLPRHPTVAYLFLVRSLTNKKETHMKTLITVIAITMIAFTAKASDPVPYIAMTIDKGYAIDAHGQRQPNALCARDVIWARGPRYPFSLPSNDRPVGRETFGVTVCIGSILI